MQSFPARLREEFTSHSFIHIRTHAHIMGTFTRKERETSPRHPFCSMRDTAAQILRRST